MVPEVAHMGSGAGETEGDPVMLGSSQQLVCPVPQGGTWGALL
jgi:hypothetical protein